MNAADAQKFADHLFRLAQDDNEPLLTRDTIGNCRNYHQKLFSLINDGKPKSPKKSQHTSSLVLPRLVDTEQLNHLIINLYSGNEGYSVGVRLHGQDELIETMKLPYEENQLLDFIDNEELPPVLVDLIENSPLAGHNLFHDGCLITEVRDHSHATGKHNNSNSNCSNGQLYTSDWLLLRPTTQSVINDIMSITSNPDSPFLWKSESRLALESQLFMATAPPLCLEPNVAVAILGNKLHRKKMNKELRVMQIAKKRSLLAFNRVKNKLDQVSCPKQFNLHEFLKKKHKLTPQMKLNKKIHPNVNHEFPNDLVPPKNVGVDRLAKVLPKPEPTAEISYVKVEEYTMEFNEDNRRSMTSVTILHRPNDDSYFGQLYINKHGQQIRGSTCIFPLGTKQSTKKYLEQFTEILTENGRKSVKIIRQVPGQPTQVTYTQAVVSNIPTVVNNIKEEAIETQASQIQVHPSPVKTPKRLASIDQSPSNSPQLISVTPSPVVTSPPMATTPTKAIETITIPAVFSPTTMSLSSDSTSPTILTTAGVQTCPGLTTLTTTLSDSQPLTVILTPSTGLTKSLDNDSSVQASPATTTALPTGVSLASLSLAPVQQNLRLHNLVSLTPQGYVPISLMMTTPSGQQQQALMTTPGSMIVSLDQAKDDDHTCSVTYATTVPVPTVLMSGPAGAGPSNVLSVPIGVAGSLGTVHQLNAASFITANQLKQAPGGQLKPAGVGQQVSLLQMTNSQSVPVLRPLAPHTIALSINSSNFTTTNSVTGTITGLTPQQQLNNALKKQQIQQMAAHQQQQQQAQQQQAQQKTPRKRQAKK